MITADAAFPTIQYGTMSCASTFLKQASSSIGAAWVNANLVVELALDVVGLELGLGPLRRVKNKFPLYWTLHGNHNAEPCAKSLYIRYYTPLPPCRAIPPRRARRH